MRTAASLLSVALSMAVPSGVSAQCVVRGGPFSIAEVEARGPGGTTRDLEVRADHVEATLSAGARNAAVRVEGSLVVDGRAPLAALPIALAPDRELAGGIFRVGDGALAVQRVAMRVDGRPVVHVDLGGIARLGPLTVECSDLVLRSDVPPPQPSAPSASAPFEQWWPAVGRLRIRAVPGALDAVALRMTRDLDHPMELLEVRGRDVRVRIPFAAGEITGWVPRRAITRRSPALPNRGATGRPGGTGVACGVGRSCCTDAIVAVDTEVHDAPGGRPIARTRGTRSFLVALGPHRDWLAIVSAPGVTVLGGPDRCLIGWIPREAATLDVLETDDLRLAIDRARDRILVERAAGDALALGLAAGDVIQRIDGSTIEMDFGLEVVAAEILGGGSTIEVTRGDATVSLPPIHPPPRRGARPYRRTWRR